MARLHVRNSSLALAAICLASLMFGLEISSVPVILPTLEQLEHASFRDMQWVMNAYTIACTAVLMGAGTLADRYGRKRIFLISLALFGATSAICGLAQSTALLVAGRFLQGMSGGAMLICQIAILSYQFQQPSERASAFAVWGMVFGVGLGFGPIVGGSILAISNWHWVFLVHVPLSIFTFALGSPSIQESRDPESKELDVLGIVTLSASVFCATYFITQGPSLGFTSARSLGILAAAVASLVLFVWVEKTRPRPMFDFSVFGIRNFSGAILGSIGMNASFWPFMIYLPMYFQCVLGYGVIASGASLLAYTLPTLMLPPLAERLSLRYQPRIVIPLGMFVLGLGFIIMRYGSSAPHANWLTMLPGCLLAGIGLGMTNTPVTNTATGSVCGTRAGMASGIDMSARLITLAINIALMGFILLEGILAHLERALPAPSNALTLHAFAEKVVSGSLASTDAVPSELSALDPSGAVIHAALVHGFGLVMLYGGIGVWGLAIFSFVVFGSPRNDLEPARPLAR